MAGKLASFLMCLCTPMLALPSCSSDGSGLPAPCAPSCGDHGICDAFSDPAACVCFPGWTGAACDECAAGYEDDGGNCVPEGGPSTCTTTSCSGHGLCDDASGQVECTCLPGYTGQACDLCEAGHHMTASGDCAEDVTCASAQSCGPHGSCEDASGTAVCVCDAGWTGELCDACAEGYHQNGADCVADETCPTVDPCAPGGVCDDASGSVVCQCLEAYAGAMCDTCAQGYVDHGSGCEAGTSCEDYPFSDNSYIYEMDFGAENETCCFDYTGDGQVDNAFGTMLALMEGIDDGIDFDLILADAIQSGDMCLLFDAQDLDSLDEDDQILLSLFSGTDSDSDYENNLNGDEAFTVDAETFEPGDAGCSMLPKNAFDSALVDRGVLYAEGAEFLDMVFPSPMAPGAMDTLPLLQVKLRANLSQGTYGVLMGEGQLGGAIPLAAIFDQLNDFADANCDCLNLDGTPLVDYSLNTEGWEVNCATLDNSTCTGTDAPCDRLADSCSYLAIFPLSADVDTDDDGITDALSVGLRFSATSATVTGITP